LFSGTGAQPVTDLVTNLTDVVTVSCNQFVLVNHEGPVYLRSDHALVSGGVINEQNVTEIQKFPAAGCRLIRYSGFPLTVSE
jgi:hypothetical protein